MTLKCSWIPFSEVDSVEKILLNQFLIKLFHKFDREENFFSKRSKQSKIFHDAAECYMSSYWMCWKLFLYHKPLNFGEHRKVADDQTHKTRLWCNDVLLWASFAIYLKTLSTKAFFYVLFAPVHEIVIKFTTRINLIGTRHLWNFKTTLKYPPINFFITVSQRFSSYN